MPSESNVINSASDGRLVMPIHSLSEDLTEVMSYIPIMFYLIPASGSSLSSEQPGRAITSVARSYMIENTFFIAG